MNRLTVLCVCFLAMLLTHPLTADSTGNTSKSIVPAPLFAGASAKGFMPGERVGINAGESQAMLDAAAWLASLMSAGGREFFVAEQDSAEVAVRLEQISEEALSESFRAAGLAKPGRIAEAYILSVGPAGVKIESATQAAQIYGLVSLWQLLEALPQDDAWPGLMILDAPEF